MLFARIFAILFSFLAIFYFSNFPLNIEEYLIFTKLLPAAPLPASSGLQFPHIYQCSTSLTPTQDNSAILLQNGRTPPGFKKQAPWAGRRVNVALHRSPPKRLRTRTGPAPAFFCKPARAASRTTGSRLRWRLELEAYFALLEGQALA